MSVVFQIAAGSGVLLLCTLLHVAVLLRLIEFLLRRSALGKPHGNFRSDFAHVIVPVMVIVVSHTIQIYIWSIGLALAGALHGYERPSTSRWSPTRRSAMAISC